MNKYQRLVVIVALLDTLVMVLFPPFNNVPLAKGMLPSFDGFYPLLTQLGHKPLHQALLALELMFIGANALTAWLLLQQASPHDIPEFRYRRGIALVAAVNLGIILLFPPFEPYPSLLRYVEGGFERFYFVFGDRSHRPIFVPLLYLECVFVAVNTLAFWLLFNTGRRNADVVRHKIEDLAANLGEEELLALSEDIRHQVLAHRALLGADPGRGEDLRRQDTPDHPGPAHGHGERRHLAD